MEIEWESEKDRMSVEELARKDRVTARRMAAIVAAKDFNDIALSANGRAHFLDREFASYFAIDLRHKTDPERLICTPTGDYQMNGTQYKKDTITSFRVIKIEKNYHKR